MLRLLTVILSILHFSISSIRAVPFHLVTPPLFGIPRCVVTGVYYYRGDANLNITSEAEPSIHLHELAVLNPSLLLLHLHRYPSSNRSKDGAPVTSKSGVDDERLITDEEYEQCERATIVALASAKDGIVHAVQDEVNIMFPAHETRHKCHVVTQVNRKVPVVDTSSKGMSNTSMDISKVQFSHDDRHRPYPYDIKGALDKEREEHNVAHAVEAVDKAVVHAIEQEVDTVFPSPSPSPSSSSSQTKPVVVQKSHRNDVLHENNKHKKSSKKKANTNDNHNHDHTGQLSLEEFLEFTDE